MRSRGGGDGSGGGGNLAGSDIASNSLVLVLLFRQLRGGELKSDSVLGVPTNFFSIRDRTVDLAVNSRTL